jgi:lysophospholipase L1-like esterase
MIRKYMTGAAALLFCIMLAGCQGASPAPAQEGSGDIEDPAAVGEAEQEGEEEGISEDATGEGIGSLEYAVDVPETDEELSFYQKLAGGQKVRILVAGDSLATGFTIENEEEKWTSLLKTDLEEFYGSQVEMDNVSLGKCDSYAVYGTIMEYDPEEPADLVILCCGYNDESTEDLALYYETAVRGIRHRFDTASLICVLPSCEKEYTDKITKIREIAEHYDAVIADTIGPFMDHVSEYSDDGVHPNAKGAQVYAGVLEDAISAQTAEGRIRDQGDETPINETAAAMDYTTWYSVDSMVREDETTWVLEGFFCDNAVIGMDMVWQAGDNHMTMKEGDTVLAEWSGTQNDDFAFRYIKTVAESLTVSGDLKLVFGSENQADGFRGILVSEAQ